MRWLLLPIIALNCLTTNQAFAQNPFDDGQPRECFRSSRPRSLLDRFLDAEILVVGRLQDAVDPDNAQPSGQTTLAFDDVLVTNAAIKGRKSIVLPEKLETSKDKFLVALKNNKDGIAVAVGVRLDENGATLNFLRGALQLKDKSPVARLRYSAKFLQDPCTEVANSVHFEFSNAKYSDVRKAGGTLDPARFAKALMDAKTPNALRATHATLLGQCGSKEHAKLLRKLIDEDDKDRESMSVLSAYFLASVLLEPKSSWERVVAHGEREDATFVRRYAALTAMRLIGREHKDLVSDKQWAADMTRLLKNPDVADFVTEDLRKAKAWDHFDAILELHGKAGFEAKIVQRSILRFALQCPSPRAKTYVVDQRARDPKWVAETLELLELEN
jgi:hypothetical protein